VYDVALYDYIENSKHEVCMACKMIKMIKMMHDVLMRKLRVIRLIQCKYKIDNIRDITLTTANNVDIKCVPKQQRREMTNTTANTILRIDVLQGSQSPEMAKKHFSAFLEFSKIRCSKPAFHGV